MWPDNDSVHFQHISEEFQLVQDHICRFFVEQSGQQYKEEKWKYDKGSGGGRTRVWETPVPTDGGAEVGTADLEKAGVNFSAIEGSDLPPSALAQLNLPAGTAYKATGVSLVIHPHNPNIPTIHMNIRYFEAGADTWWFGGGIDLTPYYPTVEQGVAFHKGLRDVCEKHDHSYADFKAHCDRYFFLKHRNEARGLGGIFFDHLNVTSTKQSKEDLFQFVRDVGMAFTELYRPSFVPNIALPFTDEMRQFQLVRRSRYVEFNLLFDRGTKFGIESGGRTESILMSLPAVCKWRYDHHYEEGSPEAKVVSFFLQPQDWVNL